MKNGQRILEWDHGIMPIVFLILKSLKPGQRAQTLCVAVAVLCTSRPGPPQTPCLKHFLMQQNKQAIHSQKMSMDSSRRVLESSTVTSKMGGVGLPQAHICILCWENEKILK